MNEQEFKKLLDNFLEGKASEQEIKLLRHFDQHFIDKHADKAFFDDKDKLDIKEQIYTAVNGKPRVKRFSALKIAATVAILISLGISLWNFVSRPFESSNYSSTPKIVQLDDGSTVTLNKDSKITFRNSENGQRVVELTGEAYFDVSRDEQKPFVVLTGELTTKVLGTSFNIKEKDSLISVTVAEGLVEVSDADNSVKLRPNERAAYNISSMLLVKSDTDHNLFTSWFKNSIKFNQVNMEQMAQLLHSRFGVIPNFLDESAKEMKMTITVKNDESLGGIIEKINYISNLEITKNPENMIDIRLKK